MYCMTVHIKEGKATIPLWAAISLIVVILIAAVGWIGLAAQRASDAEHKTITTRVQAVEDAVKAIPQMQKDIATIMERTASLVKVEK